MTRNQWKPFWQNHPVLTKCLMLCCIPIAWVFAMPAYISICKNVYKDIFSVLGN